MAAASKASVGKDASHRQSSRHVSREMLFQLHVVCTSGIDAASSKVSLVVGTVRGEKSIPPGPRGVNFDAGSMGCFEGQSMATAGRSFHNGPKVHLMVSSCLDRDGEGIR